MQCKDVDRRTFTRICNSAINWLDYGNSFFGDTDGLLITDYLHPGKTTTGQYYTEPTFKLLDVMKQKRWRKLSLKSWLFHDNAPAHKSLVAQQALRNCEFVRVNHPAYSLDWALSNYFLIRDLKYRLRGTWTMNHWRSPWRHGLRLRRNRKFYFQGINSWEQKLKICTDVAWECVKNDSMCDIIC